MKSEIGKFMRTYEDRYVIHVFKCEHCGIKSQFKENITEQPMNNRSLCDTCGRELDAKSRCINDDCSECWYF
jgi:predicted RNA-binding Zn-ribbon protein involved in translation (DUF1610 family)